LLPIRLEVCDCPFFVLELLGLMNSPSLKMLAAVSERKMSSTAAEFDGGAGDDGGDEGTVLRPPDFVMLTSLPSILKIRSSSLQHFNQKELGALRPLSRTAHMSSII